MADRYRRVIQRPPDVSDDDFSRLQGSLAEAVELQTQLAETTPHILGFVGSLQPLEDGSGLFVEHEPATSMPIGGLFDRSAPTLQESELLRMTVAVFEALRAAHVREGQRPASHGAVCPGVVLFGPDGTAKLTDFGFAAAVCGILGAEAYVNLAVNEGEAAEPDTQVTGLWEVLPRDEYERDGRICAFIDPEKYGSETLGAFEPSSDVITAAFVLHLLAEHQHPYLPDDPEAHRQVETSEFIAMFPYNGARRRDLRDSNNPAVRSWCDLIAASLARLPKNRPSASKIVEVLGEHVKPDDEGDVLRRQLGSLEALAQEGVWDQVNQAARSLAENKAAPADVVQRANALAVQAEAGALVAEAVKTLAGDSWPDAEEMINRVLAMPGLPGEIAAQAREVRARVKANAAARHTLEEIASRMAQDAQADPFQTVELTQALLDRLGECKASPGLLPHLQQQMADVQGDLNTRLEAALPAAQAAMDADRTRATEWVERVEAAAGDAEWDALDKLLATRPQIRHWPEEIQARADTAKRKLDDHRAERKRLELAEADEAAASLWADQLRLAVEAERWDRAEQLLKERPKLTYWPEAITEETAKLTDLTQAACQRRTEERLAQEWCAALRQAVEAEEFSQGAELLSKRPDVAHWPADVADEVAGYERQLERWLAEVRERQAEKDERQRKIEAWLGRADLASRNQQWKEAVDILDAPPPLEAIPDEAQARAAKLKEACLAKMAARSRGRLRARSEAVEAIARDFVRNVVVMELNNLIDPDSLEVRIDADTADPSQTGGEWQVKLRPLRSAGVAETEASAQTIAFHFRVSDESRQIRDVGGTLRGQLGNQLRELVRKLQGAGIEELRRRLEAGLFPEADITVVPGKAAMSLPATVRLLGSQSSAGCVDTELAWNPSELMWAYGAAADFVQQALRVAADAVAEELEGQVLEATDQLKRYRSILTVRTTLPPAADLKRLPDTLTLEGCVAIPPGAAVEPQTLQTFPVTCAQVGQTTCDVDLSPAVARLDLILLTAQRTHADAIRSDLQERVSDAGAKGKLTLTPKRIDTPVDRITFNLVAKGRKPLELVCLWSVEKLSFTLPDRWEDAVAEVLGQPTGAARGAGDAVGRAALRRGERRRGIKAILAITGVCAVLLLWQAWPRNQAPVALAGSNQSVDEGDRVTLDATGSIDQNGDPLTYAWTQLEGAAPRVTLSDPTVAEPVFTAPEVNEPIMLTFRVDVSDQRLTTDATVSITVNPVIVANMAPEADAGAEQTVDEGVKVTLDASASRDPEGDPVTYAWEQLGGTPVPLLGADSARPTFTAPDVNETSLFTFKVKVSDADDGTEDTVKITVLPVNQKPIADAGVDQEVEELMEVTLDATRSQDPDDDPLTYAWTQTEGAGEAVTLSDPASAEPTFTAPAVTKLTEFTFQVEVGDGNNATSFATVTVSVDINSETLARREGLRQRCEIAERKAADGDWRAARFLLDAAEAEAAAAGVTERFGARITATRQQVTKDRRALLAPLLDDAEVWLQSNVPPTDPEALLAAVEQPTAARRMLDALDLDFPALAGQPGVVEAALEQRLFPWTILTEAQTTTIQGLLGWVTMSYPLRGEDGTASGTIDLTFIPEAPEADVLDPVWMSQTEITVGQYTAAMGQAPPGKDPDGVYDDMRSKPANPVTGLVAAEVTDFTKELGALMGGRVIVRTPRAGEWTHALRCGRAEAEAGPEPRTYGPDGTAAFDPTRANFESDEEYALSAPGHNDGFGRFAPVGSYAPHPWLLHDMLGNVSEWVSASAGAKLSRVGGSFRDPHDQDHTLPDRPDQKQRFDDLGMRVVVLPVPGG